jgi:beta-RFAP synthase
MIAGRSVHVYAPSRLHFGMLTTGGEGGRRFGGVGAMISSPGLRLSIRPAERPEAVGLLRERTIACAKRTIAGSGLDHGDVPGYCIDVEGAPRQHVGLGTGTQLAMAVAAGLIAFRGGPQLDAPQLARLVGRGARSSIGIHGFGRGGLLMEAGKSQSEDIAPLVARVDLPEKWRFVVICPRGVSGLSGEAEREAFAQLAPASAERWAKHYHQATEELLPAAAAGKFEDFGEALYEFGYNAGLGFARIQGGPFAGDRLTQMVRLIRRLGVRGVGQSSWGPTLFALLADQQSAFDFLDVLRRRADCEDLDLTIAGPDNQGARIELSEGSS